MAHYHLPNPSYSSQTQPMLQPTHAPSSYSQPGASETTRGVATGTIGGGYGPYSYNPHLNNGRYNSSRFSAAPSEISIGTSGDRTPNTLSYLVTSATVPNTSHMWDMRDDDLDDPLHNPDPIRDAKMDRSCSPFSARGWINVSALVLVVLSLLTLFAGYPIITYFAYPAPVTPGYNLGGINSSGQIPDLPTMPTLLDKDTPQQAYTRTGSDGTTYQLVFSDEFETDGRTFWPGDDPYWEAVDLNYWSTGDLEWYSPEAITTQGGKLVITMSEKETHNLNFQSGMLQSWNKLCFTTGYIEMSVSLPGSPTAPGLWPAAWTMGNLGRAGYGATTDGGWPFSYDSCDVGTFQNQTSASGQPAAAATGGTGGGPLSYQPGQRVSACTCPGGDHPGPSVNVGRGVPEVDIFEVQIDVADFHAQASQSMQIAPYNYQYKFDQDASATPINDSQITAFNSYPGGVYQQAVSALTFINNSNYNNQGYATYGFELYSNPNDRASGYVQWYADGAETWKLTPQTIGADSQVEISQRLVSEEPMYIIMNLGMSPSFQQQDFKHMQFPASMYIDYVRVYQREDVGSDGLTCDPPNYPTADYINNHLNAYSNPNLTTWAQAGYTFPKNRLYNGC